MGEIADMMIDGEMCAMCGVYLQGESSGYPRYCSNDCAEGIDGAEIAKELEHD